MWKHKQTHAEKKPVIDPMNLPKGSRYPWHSKGRKVYKCDECDYTTEISSNIKSHKRKHSGEKPYKCDKCDYASTQSSALGIHKRKHNKSIQEPFKCDQCNYECTRSSDLTEHKRRNHQGKACSSSDEGKVHFYTLAYSKSFSNEHIKSGSKGRGQ